MLIGEVLCLLGGRGAIKRLFRHCSQAASFFLGPEICELNNPHAVIDGQNILPTYWALLCGRAECRIDTTSLRGLVPSKPGKHM